MLHTTRTKAQKYWFLAEISCGTNTSITYNTPNNTSCLAKYKWPKSQQLSFLPKHTQPFQNCDKCPKYVLKLTIKYWRVDFVLSSHTQSNRALGYIS